MPGPNLPPTPAASLDITGKTSTGRAPSISLGPAAVTDVASDRSISATPSAHGSDSSYHPASPVSPNMSKRKQTGTTPAKAAKATEDFALPPPPSRSRKIIQMKPKQEPAQTQQAGPATTSETNTTGKGGRKRANNSGTSAAGRKIARKTAHSLIERRRRSKMNEEFGVLKDMIPACRGQEMHKLAILQASIDYLRYLETCISDLKAGSSRPTPYPSKRPVEEDTTMPDSPGPAADDDDPDEAMSDQQPSPLYASTPTSSSAQTTRPPTSHSLSRSSQPSLPSLSHLASSSSASNASSANAPHSHSAHPSPLFTPLDASHPRGSGNSGGRHFSIGSSSAGFSPYLLGQTGNGGTASSAASPVFSPQSKGTSSGAEGAMRGFSLTSPALEPVDRRWDGVRGSGGAGEGGRTGQGQGRGERSDREAMAALLMLNHDRRAAGWRDGGAEGGAGAGGELRVRTGEKSRGGGMSVRDLLSP